jgi:hypothetical protein
MHNFYTKLSKCLKNGQIVPLLRFIFIITIVDRNTTADDKKELKITENSQVQDFS